MVAIDRVSATIAGRIARFKDPTHHFVEYFIELEAAVRLFLQFIRRSIRQKLVAFVVSLALTLGFPLSISMLA